MGADKDGKPVLRDGRPVVVGEWLRHEGEAVICESGLHAARRCFDALTYAPGPWVALCDVDDVVTEQEDKFVCRARRPLFLFDATAVLREFARACARDSLKFWPNPPAVVVEYLETGKEELRADAWDAAWAAARDAARDAARAAAWAAARAAAWAAARDAAWAAARDAAWDERISAYNADLEARILAACGWKEGQ